MSLLKVEIVTPVHNRRAETIQCLRSIARSDSTGLTLHVILVDDGSTDGTEQAVAEEFPEVEIISGNGDLWYTAGTNLGIQAALRHEPDYILAINNDSIFDYKCILKMVECAERHPRSVVGGLLLNWHTPHRVFQVSPRWELWRGGFRHWYHQTVWTVPERPWRVDIIVGNCVLYPVSAVREVGLMDERKLPQYGDAEYTPRMSRKGWNLLIEPRAKVFCKPNDPATGFRSMSIREQFDHLFINSTGPYGWKRRFFGSIGGAPSLSEGILALPVFFLNVLFGKNLDGRGMLDQKEPPLSELYRSAVVDE